MTRSDSLLPDVQRAYELAARMQPGKIHVLLGIKHLLLKSLPRDEAFRAYCNALNLDRQVSLEPRRIGSLLEAARAVANEFHILHQGGERVTCEPPEIIGPGAAPRIAGVTRTVFVACFENAVAHSKSGAIQLGSDYCFDIQAGELDSIPIRMEIDPLVFSRDGNDISAIVDQRSTTSLELDQAWSLMGVHTRSFGHWMLEYLLQFLGGHKELKLEGVPLLIDEWMPRQHRQSLELFGRGRFPIIEVTSGNRVKVKRLWVASNWFYAPHLPVTSRGLDLSRMVMPMSEVTNVYRWASSISDERSAGCHDKQIFIARPRKLARGITNLDEVALYLESQGFSIFEPERHPYEEQVRRVREARHAVIQNGSAAQLLFFARPGTEVRLLSHPWLPTAALYSELMKFLDIKMKVFTGPFENARRGHIEKSDYIDQSDYCVLLGPLKKFVEGG